MASIIRGFKSAVTQYAGINHIPSFKWQSNYYDHIVRNEYELSVMREYIENNPANWYRDRNNPEGLFM